MSTTSCTRRTKCVTMGNPCNINELDFQPVFEVPNEPITIINGVPDVTLVQDTDILDMTSNPESDEDDPCFGNWLESREVQKKVQNQIHLGTVEKYNGDENWYRVVYQDGSSENLSWEKLEEILVPLDISIAITSLAEKMCISGKAIKGRKSHAGSSKRKKETSDSAQEPHIQLETVRSKQRMETSDSAQISISQTENENIHSCKVQAVNSISALKTSGESDDTVKNDNTSQSNSSHFEGRNVLKWSGNKHYFGEVKKYDMATEFYTVVYEDGSSENLKWNELENLLVPINTPTVATVEARSDKPRKMRVNRSSGKKKTNLREQMQSDSAIQSGSMIESVDDPKTGSLIESIDTMKTGLMIESIDNAKSESTAENKGACEEKS